MKSGTGIHIRNEATGLNLGRGWRFTRRMFGGVLLGGLTSVGVGFTEMARSEPVIPTAEPDGPDHLPRRRVKVLGTEISYVDAGSGEPVVFLHGNPTWSYQWRNIIPYISPHTRCLAPDFVGMGWSGKSPTKAYRFVDHVRYMDAWFDALQLTKNVTLVVHDWGAPIGFYRALRNPGQIKAIAYYEAIVMPRRWEDYTSGRDQRFRKLRSPDGSDEEMEAYRAPYRDRDRRLPTLVWPRELPIEGVPEDVVAIVDENARWLAASASLPKLFINGDPGASISGRVREFCRTLPNQREVTVKGLHHLQEDSPTEIGEALREFVLGMRS